MSALQTAGFLPLIDIFMINDEVSMMRTTSSVFVNTLSESRRAQLAALFERPATAGSAATSSATGNPEHLYSLRAVEARGASWRDALTSTFKKPKDDEEAK